MSPASGPSEDARSEGDGHLELAPGVLVRTGLVEIAFTTSSGPGGQNVNRRSTRARLIVRVEDIPISHGARKRLREMAGHLVTEDGRLIVAADEHRSQRRNREACLERVRELIIRAKVVPKIRKKTKPSAGSVRRRLEDKRRRSEIKRNRQRPES